MIHVGEGEGRVEGEVEGYVCTALLHASRGRSDIGGRMSTFVHTTIIVHASSLIT